MPTGWQGSTRRATLPKDWWRVRWAVLERDGHRCQLREPDLCVGIAAEVDHIGSRADHRPENLRAACRPCHQHRSSQQGGQAAGERRRARVAARRRPPEPHPGMTTPPSA